LTQGCRDISNRTIACSWFKLKAHLLAAVRLMLTPLKDDARCNIECSLYSTSNQAWTLFVNTRIVDKGCPRLFHHPLSLPLCHLTACLIQSEIDLLNVRPSVLLYRAIPLIEQRTVGRKTHRKPSRIAQGSTTKEISKVTNIKVCQQTLPILVTGSLDDVIAVGDSGGGWRPDAISSIADEVDGKQRPHQCR